MAKKVSRRSFLKRALGFFAAMFGISAGGYYYARDIEPRLLEITNYKISDSAIPQAFDNKKIIQFSDTHLGFHYDLKQLQELIQKINSLKPDIVFFGESLPKSYESLLWDFDDGKIEFENTACICENINFDLIDCFDRYGFSQNSVI